MKMRKTYRGRLALKGNIEEQTPEPISTKIHVEVLQYNNEFWVDVECPSCGVKFGLPFRFWEKMVKDVKRMKSGKSPHRKIGVV